MPSQWRAPPSTLERRVELFHVFPCSFMGDSFIFNIFCLTADKSSMVVLSWLLQEPLWVHNLPLRHLSSVRRPGSLGKHLQHLQRSFWKDPHISWKISRDSVNQKCSQPLYYSTKLRWLLNVSEGAKYNTEVTVIHYQSCLQRKWGWWMLDTLVFATFLSCRSKVGAHLLPIFEYLLSAWHLVPCLSFQGAKLHCTAFTKRSS